MMSMIMTNRSVLILLAGIVGLHAGAFLVRIGLWPRRTGTDPFCRQCKYLLAGIDAKRCPECGQFLSPRTIVRGHRRRRADLTLSGAVLAVLGMMLIALCLTDRVPRMDWW